MSNSCAVLWYSFTWKKSSWHGSDKVLLSDTVLQSAISELFTVPWIKRLRQISFLYSMEDISEFGANMADRGESFPSPQCLGGEGQAFQRSTGFADVIHFWIWYQIISFLTRVIQEYHENFKSRTTNRSTLTKLNNLLFCKCLWEGGVLF